jgi:hypothetical protein
MVRLPLFGLLYQPRMIDYECGAVGGIRFGRGSRRTQRKPTLMSLCPPQIPHDVTLDRTLAAIMGSRRLTASDMALPEPTLKTETVSSSESSVTVYQTTWRYVTEGCNLRRHCHESISFPKMYF